VTPSAPLSLPRIWLIGCFSPTPISTSSSLSQNGFRPYFKFDRTLNRHLYSSACSAGHELVEEQHPGGKTVTELYSFLPSRINFQPISAPRAPSYPSILSISASITAVRFHFHSAYWSHAQTFSQIHPRSRLTTRFH
jgi:hypothetical protein